jgi:hypothetical protein
MHHDGPSVEIGQHRHILEVIVVVVDPFHPVTEHGQGGLHRVHPVVHQVARPDEETGVDRPQFFPPALYLQHLWNKTQG